MITFLSICVYLLLATTLYAWHYILEQRRTIATLREKPAAAPILVETSQPPAGTKEPDKPKPFPLNGIGPTAIRDREQRQAQDEKERTTADYITVRPPTEAEIAEATQKFLREQGKT